jgi:hypothetical protein
MKTEVLRSILKKIRKLVVLEYNDKNDEKNKRCLSKKEGSLFLWNIAEAVITEAEDQTIPNP